MPEIDFHVPKFELPIDPRTVDLESLLGSGEKVSSRVFHRNLLEQHAPEFTSPELHTNEGNWMRTYFRVFLGPDVAYQQCLTTLNYSASCNLEERGIPIFEENIPRNVALNIIGYIKQRGIVPWVDGRLFLVNPGSQLENVTYQQPFGKLGSIEGRHEHLDYIHAASLIVESLVRGVGIAEAGQIDGTLVGIGESATFSGINPWDGLVVAVIDPRVERVRAAVPELQAFGRYLSEHQTEYRTIIDVLADACRFKFDRSKPDRRPEIYAAAQVLLDGIEKPMSDGKPILNVLAVPRKTA